MQKIRVCELITELRLAGAERCVYQLATRLDADRFEVRVVALRGGSVAEMLADAGVAVTVLNMRCKWDLGRLYKLTGVLRRAEPDLVHTHLFHADLAGRVAARLAAVPHLLHTVHTAEGRFRPWQYASARLLGDYCDGIVCVSPSVRDYHCARSGLPRSQYTVIPNGIDAAAFVRDEQSRSRLRREWGLGDDQPVVVFVGRLDQAKGIETLLSAMSHLAARGQALDLVIAGDGPKRHIIENFIRHGEGGRRCRLLGFVQDVQAVLSAADIFVMPSRWEGFGLAAVEAMAASLPVVATRVPGLRDVIKDGESGLMIDCGDVFGLAERIERLAHDPPLRQRLGQRGRQCVVRKYSVADMIAAHEDLYARIAADVPTRRDRRIDAGWDE